MLKWLWLSGLVIVLDQLTKQVVLANFQLYEVLPVTPMFNLTLMFNSGAAFSFLADASGWQRWFFTAIAVVVSVVIVTWLKRMPDTDKLLAVALALVLGGALGNVWDRIMLGHVVDFIQVYWDVHYFPAFNIADSAITLGAALLLWDGFFGKKRAD